MISGFEVTQDPDNPTLYEVWVESTEDKNPTVKTRVCQFLNKSELAGMFYGVELAEMYGPVSIESVRSFRHAIRMATGESV